MKVTEKQVVGSESRTTPVERCSDLLWKLRHVGVTPLILVILELGV